MRISDWSSDVCSSDLAEVRLVLEPKSRNVDPEMLMESLFRQTDLESRISLNMNVLDATNTQIGRASCRERVCQYVYISVVAVSLKKHNNQNRHTTILTTSNSY